MDLLINHLVYRLTGRQIAAGLTATAGLFALGYRLTRWGN